MTWAIETTEQMQQTLEQLGRLYAALVSLRHRVEPLNPRNFAILAEGHVDHIRRLQRQLDEYAGVTNVKQKAPRKPRAKAVAKRSRRQAAAR